MSHSHDQSCCSSKCGCSCHSHSSCGEGHKSCGCSGSCGSSCGCQKKGCGCKKEDCDTASKFLALADCAWMEVLKEKIKENIQANAQHMDELARLISDANRQRWQKKMQEHDCCDNFEEKLNEFFCQACHTEDHNDHNKQGNNPQGNNPKGNNPQGNQKK